MRRLSFFCLALLVVAGAMVRAATTIRIVPIVRDQAVIVTVELTDGYTAEVREAIASGLRTTFTYDVDVRMVVPAWVDRTVATRVIGMSDRYDNLTRRHNLSRMVDGRVEEAIETDDEEVVKKWLTSLNALAVCPTSKLDPNRDYYVRISASVRPPGASLLGWANAITNQTKFTFIP
ncbi:MAG: DUF4390 domain-containing protein [Vicinamibacterales bacterium]|nr:DUF4390 domain-containing protein [Vicinamibacterales bacterium]